MAGLKEIETIKDLSKTLINLAIKEGKRFELENGRKPTEAEAERMAKMIQDQFNTALVMAK